MRFIAVAVAVLACSSKKDSGSEANGSPPSTAPRHASAAVQTDAAVLADAATPPPIAGAPIVVTVETLIGDYKASESKADDKYRNRAVEITGTVGTVGKDALGFGDFPGNVLFKAKLGEVQANAGSAAISLKSGQTATLRCTGKGVVAELGMPLLGDCTIIRP